jgi:excisionase family DNA binding protein
MAKFITTTEAAVELRITVRRVQALIAAGRLRASRVGRDWLIEPRDLEKVRDRPRGRPKTIRHND